MEAFPGHIACSSESKSEIVIPLLHEGKTHLVLDVDSNRLNDFGQLDQEQLERIVDMIRIHHWGR